ncbi:MAG: calcium/sodium antiporter [Fidelibacterota bacterium]
MIGSLAFLILGGLLLYFGAEWIVKGGSRLASQIGLSPLVIGLTIVAFGTSLPELVVSLTAAIKDSSTIAVGNVIGSNIANIGLVLGLSSLIFPITITFSRIRSDLIIYIFSALLFTYFCSDGLIDRSEGVLLFLGIISYTWYCIAHPHHRVEKMNRGDDPITKNLLFLLIGAILLFLGSNLFVEGAISIAEILGVSKIAIGMSVVAFGTSLPELATSIVAAFHKESGISVGNIIGSNLFNILSVIGIVSWVHPLKTPQEIMYLEIPFMIAFGAILFPVALMKQPIAKSSSGILLAGYILFVFLLFN